MRTKVLESIQSVLVSEDGDFQSVRFRGVAHAFIGDIRKTGNPDPILCSQFGHVTNDILTAFELRVTINTIMRTELKSKIAKRMLGVQGEAAFETLARANELERQGRHIVHLEIGEPDFDTPAPIVRAGIDWLQKGKTHYAPVAGVPELREAVAARLSKLHKVTVAPANVLISPGAKLMIFAVIHSIVDPGDEVIYPA